MLDFILTALACVIGALALLRGWLWLGSRWLSRQKLDAMQGAFRFLQQDFGMRYVRRWDQGMGAEVRFADAEADAHGRHRGDRRSPLPPGVAGIQFRTTQNW